MRQTGMYTEIKNGAEQNRQADENRMDAWLDGRMHAWKERNWHNKEKINSTSVSNWAHYQRQNVFDTISCNYM
jgi:hypothetical protein